MNNLSCKPLFKLGHVAATPGALDLLTAEQVASILLRHMTGDWGDLSEADKQENDYSVTRELRIFSKYYVGEGENVWVITEADRSSTTILRPDEY